MQNPMYVTTVWGYGYKGIFKTHRSLGAFLPDHVAPGTEIFVGLPGAQPDVLCRVLAERVPQGLTETLHRAFFHAFSLLFEKGEGIVRWAGRQQRREEAYQVRRFAADLPGRPPISAGLFQSRRQDRPGQRGAGWCAGRRIGAVGDWIAGYSALYPDAPENHSGDGPVSFGFTGSELEEQIWILRLIEAALSDGAELEERNQALNGFIQDGTWPDSPVLEQQMQQTAHSLSQAMLYWKFVQGIPLVGAVGGAWDAVCLRRVQRYAAIKYSRRFLIDRKLGRQARENAR